MSAADIEKNISVSHLFDYYDVLLSERQRDVINLYYNDDFSLSEIADLIGITRQGVRDAIKKSEILLTDYESKLGFAKLFDSVTEAADNLLKTLGQYELNPDITALSEELKIAIQSAFT
ncbi:MAG: YlxM family DNA-binding protein [Eubacteriales bacterium]